MRTHELSASHWIYGAVPPGSNLTAEYWDDALPRTLAYALSPVLLWFWHDHPRSLSGSAACRSAGCHLRRHLPCRLRHPIIAAGRVGDARGTVALPGPGTLFRAARGRCPGIPGQSREFERSPAVGNVAIDDREADESFINYDHPRVTIYERPSLSRTDYDAVMSWAMQRPWYAAREPVPTLLLDGPVGQNPSV